MIWPPVKAWSCKRSIENQVHFVAINYGGQLKDRWVILMSVLDSSVVVKISWSRLANPSDWECGWDGNNYSESSELVNSKYKIENTSFTHPSIDSGLTIPITKSIIRSWHVNI